jgi:hypothetical protein
MKSKSVRKIIWIMNLLTLCVLGYYAVTKGLHLMIGIALALSVITNTLYSVCEIRQGKEIN